jgi:very-short-patch-repair endonuclease
MSEVRSIGTVEAGLAARQHGIVTRTQLRTAGFSDDIIDRRIRTRRLVRIHRGVYLVGVVAPPYAHELAACLACGPLAVLSHRSAAVIWQIMKGRARPARLEVTIPEGYRRHPGLRVYRIGTLRPDEVTRVRGIPITTAARTLYDLAGRLRRRPLERAVAEAIALRLTTATEVRAMALRQAGRRGAGRLRAVLDLGDPRRTRSEAEEIFLGLVRRGGIELPVVNTRVAGYEVDFYWPAAHLAVEVDGFAFHISRRAFEQDRRRDAELATLGVRVVRVTWRQITEEPEAVVRRLKGALSPVAAGP